MSDYFSDREYGARPRDEEAITPLVWGGIVAIIEALIENNGLAKSFPRTCADGGGIFGTDKKNLERRVKSEHPKLDWPLVTVKIEMDFCRTERTFVPETMAILDFLEFVYRECAEPIQNEYHSYPKHYHLSFDPEVGKENFRTKINKLMSRNGVAYELNEEGIIVRLVSEAVRMKIRDLPSNSGDSDLNLILKESMAKFLSPDIKIRKEALDKLYDSFERIKSLNETDKKRSAEKMLSKMSAESNFRTVLRIEALELTKIGNSFFIRHAEASQTPIIDPAHVDYLFHRLLAFVTLALTKSQGTGHLDDIT